MPDDPRAGRLLGEMDARFFGIVEKLPDPLRVLARTRGTYEGSESQVPFEGPSSMNPGLTCTPWMFWQITREVGDQQFAGLSVGGGLVILASTLLDHLVDRQVKNIGETGLLQSALHGRGMAILRSEIGLDAEFWSHAERLLEEHRRGLAQEIQWRTKPDLLTEERFVETVSAKFAPIALTMVAYLAAAERRIFIEPIERSIKDLAVASQLLDDLGDWEEDVRQQRLTLYVKSLAPRADWTADEWPTVTELEEQIDQEWAELELLNRVRQWLDRSIEKVAGIECPAWISYLNGFRDLADQHLMGRTAGHLARSIGELLPDQPGTS